MAMAATIALAVMTVIGAAAVVPVAASGTGAVPGGAGEAWWVPLGFRHSLVSALSVRPDGTLLATVAGRGERSADGGRTFQRLASAGPPAAVDAHCPPSLGAPATLVQCAAPASLPGVLVGVGLDGTVWRRTPEGAWGRALLLLPAGGLSGVPGVTSIAAFGDSPVSDAVYVGTRGYGVIESGDGGDDWIRDDPGLPPNVVAMATDSLRQAVYAGTDDGLWVHHVQASPAPPAYAPGDLSSRRLLTALVTLVALGLSGALLALMLIASERPVPRTPSGETLRA